MTRTPELLMDLLPRLFLDLALVLLVLLGSSLHRCHHLVLKFVCQRERVFLHILEILHGRVLAAA